MNVRIIFDSKAGVLFACLLLSQSSSIVYGQSSQADIDRGNARTCKVYNTKPAILAGPFILNPSETSATIEWITDTPSQAKVEYGEGKLDHEAVSQEYGLIPVGTLQRVELTDLLPGHTYQYRVVSTRVVNLKPYFPDKGLSVESPTYGFTTFDAAKRIASFSFITDTHEDVLRVDTLMHKSDWKTTDFLVYGGDGVNYAESEKQVFENWLGPVSRGLNHTKPLIYVRGNHDMRGPFARNLTSYLLSPTGQYYYTRDDGPIHLIAVDTGEDKPDNTNEYGGLLNEQGYREQEFSWLRSIVSKDSRMATAPFRVMAMHQPSWGWLDNKNQKWTDLANQGMIDLVIAGHEHHFRRIQPGQWGNNFPILIVGQDQVAHVDATDNELKVTVTSNTGAVIDSFTVLRRGAAH